MLGCKHHTSVTPRSSEMACHEELIWLFTRATLCYSAGNRDRNVSVRLSVTRRYCVMIFAPSGSPKDSSFLTPNFITKF